MMQREERGLEMAIDTIIQRVNELKQSLQELLFKLEHEGQSANWPDYLTQYSVLSAQMCSLLKVLRNDKTPLLRNYLTLPLQLNAEPDDTLLKITENRVPAFSHDFVPNLLRTKPDPDLETKHLQLHTRMSNTNADTSQKQINLHNKIVRHIVDHVSSAKGDWESETASRTCQPATFSVNENQIILAALGTGKGLKPQPLAPNSMAGGTSVSGIVNQNSAAIQQQTTNNMKRHGMNSKAPSAIKTNIKAAGSVHPYNR